MVGCRAELSPIAGHDLRSRLSSFIAGSVRAREPEVGPVAKDCMKCISRESNPGHIDGNDVFYH